MNRFQACRKVVLGSMLVMSIIMLGICANIISSTRIGFLWGALQSPPDYTPYILGLATAVLSVLSLPLLIMLNLRVVVEFSVMNMIWILWMTEAILVSEFRASGSDWRLSFCIGSPGEPFCQQILAIQAFACMLFILGFLYVFAFCFCVLGIQHLSREQTNPGPSTRWHSLFFEQSRPPNQVVVVQVPATAAGEPVPGEFESPPPMFTDCQCACHLIHSTYSEKDSKISPV
ncbi:hypothetical protein BJ165DRAFT_1440496 [Panaeolus papilionaceus]|nr:hypothetical protein BJ165DRAFT_1440496 [Panaeolus papilionaceus]